MLFAEFHNALRILANIDMRDLVAAGALSDDDTAGWQAFRDNPWRWFIQVGDAERAAVWRIVLARQPKKPDPQPGEKVPALTAEEWAELRQTINSSSPNYGHPSNQYPSWDDDVMLEVAATLDAALEREAALAEALKEYMQRSTLMRQAVADQDSTLVLLWDRRVDLDAATAKAEALLAALETR